MKNDTNIKTILVMDDDPDLLMQLEMQLVAAGFYVCTAQSQNDAEKLLHERMIDLAILDLMADHQDTGFVLCYRIRKNWPDIPIILISAVTSETGIEFDAGTREERSWIKADLFLAKPLRQEQLIAEVQRLIHQCVEAGEVH